MGKLETFRKVLALPEVVKSIELSGTLKELYTDHLELLEKNNELKDKLRKLEEISDIKKNAKIKNGVSSRGSNIALKVSILYDWANSENTCSLLRMVLCPVVFFAVSTIIGLCIKDSFASINFFTLVSKIAPFFILQNLTSWFDPGELTETSYRSNILSMNVCVIFVSDKFSIGIMLRCFVRKPS